MYVIYLVHRLFLTAPKQCHEEQPHVPGAQMPHKGKMQGQPHSILYCLESDPAPMETIHSQEYWVVARATWLNCGNG